MEKIPSKVERWYDRHTRSWVVQLKDDEGNQIDDAIYVASKPEAIRQENEWKKVYKI
jgi:hypothetical protein